jgi:hypothetical protein
MCSAGADERSRATAMNEISENNSARARSSTEAVREIFATGAELTDAELVARIPDLHRGQIIPARLRLERLGEVELARKNDAGHNVWRRTPEDRREEARLASEQRKKKPVEKLARLKPDARAQVVAALLEDGDVNRILREQAARGRAARRARARAHESHAETEAERRERKRALREAEGSAYIDFLKVHDGLRDTVSILFGIRSFMREELERRDRGDETKIPPERWSDVDRNLHEVVLVGGAVWHDLAVAMERPHDHCPLCGERTERDPRALDEGYIDAEAEEDSADHLVGNGEDA